MTSKEILEKYVNFFLERDHKLIPNVSLVPEGDSTLLFVNSGMFPLVPYLSGQPHPLGKRLVNVQRAIRFEDMDEVGDNRHTTAFHMIGNWSLGDYFKEDQLNWAYQFLIEELKLSPSRIFASVFKGDESAPRDEESIDIIKSIFEKYGLEGKENKNIFAYGKKSNWWQRGEAVGELGGPDSEIYYYMKDEPVPQGMGPEDDENLFFEICNSVFMQYVKTEKGWEQLPQANVDFGGGLERIAVAVQGKNDIYETDNFWPIIEKICEKTDLSYYSDQRTTRNMRVLADHMRAAVFLAMDGVMPGNKDQGYILRRLLRRMVRAGKALHMEEAISVQLVPTVVEMFSWMYPQLKDKQSDIQKIFAEEEIKFFKVLKRGHSQVKKILDSVDGHSSKELAQKAFDLFQSAGYPHDIFLADIKDSGISVSEKEFNDEYAATFEEHQNISRAGSEKKFKGGLADSGEISKKYHTATHLLQRALKNTLGEEVRQLGSNITSDRLRFDFPYPQKLSAAQLHAVETEVNKMINQNLSVNFVIMPKEEALSSGAIYLKDETYPDSVKIYYVGDSLDTAYSKEFCGGPHVKSTGEIGGINIFKNETIGEGRQRIYARLSNQGKHLTL